MMPCDTWTKSSKVPTASCETRAVQRNLQKWHGAGNDFVIDLSADARAVWNARSAKAVCDRESGIGADGLLLGNVDDGLLSMTLFNADGSLAEMSGNGIRCLVAAHQRARRDDAAVVLVRTLAGVREVTMSGEGDARRGSVSMGAVTLGDALEGSLGVATVGNPHVVVLDREDWSPTECETLAMNWSKQVGGANVEFVTPVDASTIAIRVIERGVGWTLACGTGSCASAVVAREAGLVGDEVTVRNPGGDLLVQLRGYEATLEGPVVFVGDRVWTIE